MAYRFKIIELCDSVGKADFVIPTDQVTYRSLKTLTDKALSLDRENFNHSNILNEIRGNYDNLVHKLRIFDAVTHEPVTHGDNSSFITQNLSKKPFHGLYIGSTTSMSLRFIYQLVAERFVREFHDRSLTLIFEQLTPFYPALISWHIEWNQYDFVVLANFQLPHPVVEFLLQQCEQRGIPVMFAHSFASRFYLSNSSPVVTVPEFQEKCHIDYPALLLGKSDQGNSTRIKNGIIGVFVVSNMNGADVFPQINADGYLRSISKSVRSATSENHQIIVFTMDDNSFGDAQSLASLMMVSDETVRRVRVMEKIFDAKSIVDLISSMELVFTMDDFSSSICIQQRVPFVQFVFQPSRLLAELDLSEYQMNLQNFPGTQLANVVSTDRLDSSVVQLSQAADTVLRHYNTQIMSFVNSVINK